MAARPIGDNFNRYWYANNNPYKFTDPDGREAGYTYNRDGSMHHAYMDYAPNPVLAKAALAVWPLARGAAAVRAIGSMVLKRVASDKPAAPNQSKPDQTVYRLGTSKESPTRLGNKAAEAEGKIGVHGVSASTTKPSAPCSSASCSSLESAGLNVRATPTRNDPGHVTVELPKPVTKEVADKFNGAFGRK